MQEKGHAMNLPEQDVRKLCHELEVHQIELELQNEALQDLQVSLQVSEEKYRDLYEFAPIGYYTLDPNGEILETNLAGASLLGRGRARLIGARLQFFLEPEDIDLLNAFIDRAGSSDTKEACDVRLKRNGGEPAWVLLEGKSAAEGDGTRIRVAATDITKRKQAERALQESEERERRRATELQAVMEAVPAAVFIALDPESRTIYGSRWTYDLFRIPPGGNLSKSAPEGERPTHFRTMKDGAEIPPAELPIQKAAATGRPAEQVELDLTFDDGTMRHLLGNAVPLLDESGRSYGAVGAFIDITERKRAEEALRESEEKYRHLIEKAPETILIHQEGKIKYVNPEGMRLLGISRMDKLIDQDILSIVPPAYRDQIRSNIRANFEEGASSLLEVPLLRADGSLVSWIPGNP